jgi:hypothetical protein
MKIDKITTMFLFMGAACTNKCKAEYIDCAKCDVFKEYNNKLKDLIKRNGDYQEENSPAYLFNMGYVKKSFRTKYVRVPGTTIFFEDTK